MFGAKVWEVLKWWNMNSDELYRKRNELLHRATSFRAKTRKATLLERAKCFLEADRLTKELEEYWACQSSYTPPNVNLYDTQGRATHFLQWSDGIQHTYVPVARWVAAEQSILELDPVDRLRRHEIKLTQDELEFQEQVEELYIRLSP